MKILNTLMVAQLLLTLFVILKLVDIDSRVDKYEAVTDRPSSAAMDFVDSQSNFAPVASSGLSDDQLRRIIREELLAHAPRSAQPVVGSHQDSSSEAVDAPVAVFFVQMDDRFGVGIGGKPMAFGDQLGPQLTIVVDFSVEGDPYGAVFVADRLPARGKVNNA